MYSRKVLLGVPVAAAALRNSGFHERNKNEKTQKPGS